MITAVAESILAVSFFLTLLLQTVFGYSPLRTGAAFLPFSVGIVATSESVAKLIGRVQPRVFATAGPLVAAVALLWLSRIHATSTYFGAVLGPLVLLSVGLGLAFVPLTLGATSGVPPADMGAASALLNTSQQVGGTLGLAVLVTVATTATQHALTSGASRPLGHRPARWRSAHRFTGTARRSLSRRASRAPASSSPWRASGLAPLPRRP